MGIYSRHGQVTVYLFMGILFTLIVWLFWREEIRYSLPTPVPEGYELIAIDSKIDLNNFLQAQSERPVFLHFFNPDCPCSRFNIKHFGKLIATYGEQVQFYAVLQVREGDQEGAIERFQKRYRLQIPTILDHQERLAERCGVYATPQAVILDKETKLYYRGNYNRARYCTDRRFNYAQMAIDSILDHRPPPIFNTLAAEPYGCELPSEQVETAWLDLFE